MNYQTRKKIRSALTSKAAYAIYIALAVLVAFLLVSCDEAPFVPSTEDPVGTPIDENPSNPDPGPTDDPGSSDSPTTATVVTTHTDTLRLASATIGVGGRGEIPGSISSTGERTFNVFVGLEGPICDDGRIEIVGISDDGTAGSNRGALTPADAFTAWKADACLGPDDDRPRVLAWSVPFGPGGGRYDFAIVVDGLEHGKAEVRAGFEIAGHAGESFRWTLYAPVDVVP